jgi:hypothetical protein
MPASQQHRIWGVILTGSLALAGCGGGGGGITPTPPVQVATPTPTPPTPTPPTPTPPTPTPPTPECSTACSVDAPAPPSYGSSPPPAQIATPGGPTILGQSNVLFPALTTSVQFDASGVRAVQSDQSATVTVIDAHNLQVTIPAVNVNGRIWEMAGLILPGAGFADEPVIGLNYVALGNWQQNSNQPSNTGNPQNYTLFAFGYETPATAMPTSGTATFSGTAQGSEFAPIGTQGQIVSVGLSGNAALSVDFASGNIAGSFTQMNATNYQAVGTAPYVTPWNDVSVSASIAAGTNKFSGTTAATSNPQSAYSLSASAKGSVVGAFYGPNAQELGAIWTLSDGKASAIGGVAAAR